MWTIEQERWVGEGRGAARCVVYTTREGDARRLFRAYAYARPAVWLLRHGKVVDESYTAKEKPLEYYDLPAVTYSHRGRAANIAYGNN